MVHVCILYHTWWSIDMSNWTRFCSAELHNRLHNYLQTSLAFENLWFDRTSGAIWLHVPLNDVVAVPTYSWTSSKSIILSVISSWAFKHSNFSISTTAQKTTKYHMTIFLTHKNSIYIIPRVYLFEFSIHKQMFHFET